MRGRTMIVNGNIVRQEGSAQPVPNPWRNVEEGVGRSSYGTTSGGGGSYHSLNSNGAWSSRFFPGLRLRSLTAILTLIQVGVFFVEWAFTLATDKNASPFSVTYCTLYKFGGKWSPGIRYNFEFYRLLAPIFLHINFIHIAVNMLSQCSIMPMFENASICGWKRLLGFYILCGIGANLVSCVFAPYTLSAGASGSLFAVFSLHGCFLFSRWSELDIQQRQAMKSNLAINISVNLLLTFSAPAIDTSAHLGGLVFGVLGGISILRPPDDDHFGIHAYKTLASVAFILLFLIFTILIWLIDFKKAAIKC